MAPWHGLSVSLDADGLVGRRREELLCGERWLLSLRVNRCALGPGGRTSVGPSPHHWAALPLPAASGLAKGTAV